MGHGKKDPDPEPEPSGESVSCGGERVEVFIEFTAVEPEPSGESVSGGGEKVEVFIGFIGVEPELADTYWESRHYICSRSWLIKTGNIFSNVAKLSPSFKSSLA